MAASRARARAPSPRPVAALASAAPARSRGRPRVISDEQLLSVARDVFLERGIRATTAEVASRAGVAEGTIFNRFKSKDALFRAAMHFDPDQVPTLFESLASRVGEGDLRKTLVDFANQILEIGRVALPVMMMSWSNPAGEYSFEKHIGRREPYRRALGAVCAFFEAEMRAGRLRMMDPEVPARTLMGSLHHFCLTELFTSGDRLGCLTSAAYAEGIVDLLLRSLDYEPTDPSARRARELSRL